MPSEPPPALLSAGHVVLRTVAEQDWPLERALSLDPDVVRWTSHPADLTEAGSRRRVARHVEAALRNSAHWYAVVLDDELAGLAGVGLSGPVPELFYALLPRARGRGAATAAVRALSAWALGPAGAPSVRLRTKPGNAPSEAVARRAGFVPDGTEVRPFRGTPQELVRWVRFPDRSGA